MRIMQRILSHQITPADAVRVEASWRILCVAWNCFWPAYLIYMALAIAPKLAAFIAAH